MGKIDFVSKFVNNEMSLSGLYALFTQFRFSDDYYENIDFYMEQESILEGLIVRDYMRQNGFYLKFASDVFFEKEGEYMFKAWIQNEYGETVKELDNCLNVRVYTEEEMQFSFPDVYNALDVQSDYICIVDLDGRHFYPLYICSVNIG